MTDILITDDEHDIRALIADILEDEGFSTRTAGNSNECMDAVAEKTPDLMILDIWLKDSNMDGIDILREVKKSHPHVPIVIISGHGNIEIAVAAIKQGAYDFIEKPFNIDQLLVVIRRAVEASKLRQENSALKRADAPAAPMLGESPIFTAFKAQLDKVVKSNGRVMLRGGAGAGKETAARYIHSQSNRASGPFVVVSAASIAPDQMEDVLFGRADAGGGAHPGLLEQADGGVLYFDEIADMPLGTQSKILRVLVDQTFSRVGGSDKIKVDMRVISSTARDLTAEIAGGTFREELYHRLNVVPIDVPSLEERCDDVVLLANHFIAQLNQEQGLTPRVLSDEAGAALQTMVWPGNVRQLRNVVERMLILGDSNGPIEASELPGQSEEPENTGRMSVASAMASLPLRDARELFEREYLLTQINRFGGNISRTAAFVGMERSALHRKLKSLGIVTTSKGGARVAALEDTGQDEAQASEG